MSGTGEGVHASDIVTDIEHEQSCSPLGPEGDYLPTDAQLAISKSLKQRRAARQKNSIDRRSLLQIKPRARTQLDLQGEHLSALLQAQEAARRLPKQSAYAKHRLACIEKARSLLESQRYVLLRQFPL